VRRFLLMKLVHVVVVLLLVSLLTIVMLDLTPGGPAYAILGETATAEQVEALNEQMGLNRPLIERYGDWITNVLSGDFGQSYRTGQPVFEAIKTRMPVTIELAVMALVMSLVISIPLAVYVAYRSDGRFDRIWSVVSSVLISAPHFVVALLAAFVLAVKYRFFPVTGWVPLTEDLGRNLKSAFLPALTLSLGEIAIFSRVLRADMITTLQNDFVLAARAKGLSAKYVLFRHALRPSSFSLLTLAGLSLGRFLGGAVIVEVIFALPGLGQLMVQSIFASDLFMVQGLVMFIAVIYVALNALVDIAYAYLDPRVREARSR
jgi:peptide/nickel transport system permease protein